MVLKRFAGVLLRSCLVCACLYVVTLPTAWGMETLKDQRSLYKQAQQWLDNKQVKKYYRIKDQLKSYPLSPYLDYRSILVDIENKPPIVIRNFINSHADFPFSNRIAAPYLSALAEHDKWSVLLQFQKTEPRNEKYRCYYYTALLKTGKKKVAFQGAESLWLKGRSVSDACDGLFSAWEKAQGIPESLVLERMFLAFEQRQFSLMKYLENKLTSEKGRNIGRMLLMTYRHPDNVEKFLAHGPLNDHMLQLVSLGLKSLASTKPKQAYHLILDNKLQYLDSDNQQAFYHYLAKILIGDEDISSSMQIWRDEVIASSQNEYLVELRVRDEIRSGNWQGIYQWVRRLPDSLLKTTRWQFWLGLSEVKSGQKKSGMDILENLSGRRDFYSTAAASYLNQSFGYSEPKLDYDPTLIEKYQTALIRIHELIDMNKLEASKSEWYWLLKRASTEEQAMLAQYAAESHWYHLTVIATIQAQLWEHLELRFPKAYLQLFELFGNKNGIDPITLISVARQESAMDIRAYSPVGAKGIMQLMPSTARYMAKKYRLNYKNSGDLFNVKKNIELGSRYLNELLTRYDGNRILAFAAYNAGPSRVDQWLQRSSGDLDVYRFIEAIPYRETRGYVQNILMFETYYRHLLGIEGNFLYPGEVESKY